MKKAILLCALALQPVSVSVRQFVREYHALVHFLKTCYPDYEFAIIPRMKFETKPKRGGWEYVPVQWRNTVVYMRPMRESALALPVGSVHYQPATSISVSQYIKEYKELKAWLMNTDPNADWLVIPAKVHATPQEYKRMFFKWRGHLVYWKRAA